LNFSNENSSHLSKIININSDVKDKTKDDWSYENEWFEETNVSIKIKEYLEKNNHEIIKFNLDKWQKGHDIVTMKNDKKNIVEVKGYPSDKYVYGIKKGKKKPTHPNLQAKHWFSEALLSLLLAKCVDWNNIEIGLGIPKIHKYEELVQKIDPLRKRIGIKCYFIDETGKIEDI